MYYVNWYKLLELYTEWVYNIWKKKVFEYEIDKFIYKINNNKFDNKEKLIIINKKGRRHKSVCQIKIALCCETFSGVKNSKMVGLYRKKVGRQVHKFRLQNVLLDNADRWQGRQCVNRSFRVTILTIYLWLRSQTARLRKSHVYRYTVFIGLCCSDSMYSYFSIIELSLLENNIITLLLLNYCYIRLLL